MSETCKPSVSHVTIESQPLKPGDNVRCIKGKSSYGDSWNLNEADIYTVKSVNGKIVKLYNEPLGYYKNRFVKVLSPHEALPGDIVRCEYADKTCNLLEKGKHYTFRSSTLPKGELVVLYGLSQQWSADRFSLVSRAEEPQNETNPKIVDEAEDVVNNPSHYTTGGIENIDYIKAKLTEEQYQGFLLGNALKYLGRANHKSNFDQDLGKAQFYVNRLVKERERHD